MIFGKKELFAVEAVLTQSNEYVFIQFCYWAKGRMIGDLDQYILLKSAIYNFSEIIAHRGKRGFPPDILKADELISTLLQDLSDDKSSSYTGVDQVNTMYLDINYSRSESMDGYYTFLVEMSSYDWLLCRDTVSGKNYDVKIPKNQFYNQIESLLNWIDKSTALVLRSDHTN